MKLSKPAIKARQRNAQKSSGPKSEAGKARVSRNALSHGLAVPYGLLPNVNPLIEALAEAFLKSFGVERPDPSTWSAACLFAEAQLDLNRIRAIRCDTLTREIVTTRNTTLRELKNIAVIAERIEDPWEAIQFVDEQSKDKIIYSNPPLMNRYKLQSPLLARIDRYERRAFSRRKRAFDLLAEIKHKPKL